MSYLLASLFWFLVGFMVAVLLLWFLLRARPRRPAYKIPDRFDGSKLAEEIGLRILGSAADGSERDPLAAPGPKVIWVDEGDEVLVHLDSTRVRVIERSLLVSVDLETDQTGRSPVVVAFALGNREDQAGLFAVTAGGGSDRCA